MFNQEKKPEAVPEKTKDVPKVGKRFLCCFKPFVVTIPHCVPYF